MPDKQVTDDRAIDDEERGGRGGGANDANQAQCFGETSKRALL